jgi:outer membrane receptor protein involved in Fe transport
VGVRYERLFGRFLSGYLHFVYRDVTDRSSQATRGRQLPMHPRSQAVLGLNYIDRAGTKLFLEADWRDEMFIDPIWSDNDFFDPRTPRERFPSKLRVNLRLARERSVHREWVLRVNNLFNTETIYWPEFPAPGRTVELQYRVRF